MKPFEDVSVALQIGVRKTPYAPSRFVSGRSGDGAEKLAILDAGVLDLLRRAGASPTTSVLPLSTAPTENAKIAHLATAPLLEAIDLGLREVVLEWVKSATEKEIVAPHSVLLKLLEWSPKQREILSPVLGERGRWLAGLMGLDLGAPEVKRSPEELLTWLRQEWPNLDWKEKLHGLEQMRGKFLTSDEPFLVSALTDRRKEVRELAVLCLIRLDQSALVQELHALMKGRLGVERLALGRRLLVSPPNPEELPKYLPRTAPTGQPLGAKALGLKDVLQLIHPEYWTSTTGLSPQELIPLVDKSEYADAVREGWEIAAIAFKAQRWIDALFEDEMRTERPMPRCKMAVFASPELFESSWQSRLDKATYLPPRTGRYSAAFSAQVVSAVKRGTAFGSNQMVHNLHDSVLPLLNDPWEPHLEATREYWYRVIDIRKRLADSLES